MERKSVRFILDAIQVTDYSIDWVRARLEQMVETLRQAGEDCPIEAVLLIQPLEEEAGNGNETKEA